MILKIFDLHPVRVYWLNSPTSDVIIALLFKKKHILYSSFYSYHLIINIT